MIIVLLSLLLASAGTCLGYRLSSTYRVKKRIQSALSPYEETDAELWKLHETLRNEVQQTSDRFVEKVHKVRLQSIPLDTLKNYGTGLRLQALKDSGIRSIADIEGWGEYRISQVRGVGSKSAGTIARATASIIAECKSKAIPHPVPPFHEDKDRQLMQALYWLRWFDSHLLQKGESFRQYISARQTTRDELVLGTSFSRWVWKFGANATVQERLVQTDALVNELEGSASKSMREELLNSLSELRGICSGRTDAAAIAEDFSENYEFYDFWLTSRLGKNPRQHSVFNPTEASQASNNIASNMRQNSETAKSVDTSPSSSSPSHSGETLVTVQIVTEDIHPQEFLLPRSEQRAQARQAIWIPKGKSLQIQGRTLPRGLFYYGKGIEAEQDYVLNPWLSAKSDEPNLVDPQNYSHSYARLSPQQRGRYLDWLAEGAISSSDVAFGTMYFYGLERRLLEWLQNPPTSGALEEMGVLVEELKRLANLFRRQAGGAADSCERLLDFAASFALDGATLAEPPAFYGKGMELPFLLRYGIGCMMRDGKPIPAMWALRWAYFEPTIYLRTPATRCPEAFESAFFMVYQEKYGEGLIVRPNKTFLRLRYQPGWPMHLGPEIRRDFSGIPDVSAITGPLQTLKSIVEESTNLIDSYSRYLGRNTAKAGTLEGLLHLPNNLWSGSDHDRWEAFLSEMVSPMTVRSLTEVLHALGDADDSALAKISEIAANLSRAGVGFEPDILNGVRRPKPDEAVVLFPLTAATESDRTSQDFKRASLTVALSACVALADGHASDDEAMAVKAMVSSWQHLPEDSRLRLHAQYTLQVAQGISLSSLKSRFTALTSEGKMQMAQALSALASVDGNIAAAEVRLLEQVYRALELEPQLLYSHLHGSNRLAIDARVATPEKPNTYSVDATRLAALRQETEQVSALLAGVFQDEDNSPAVQPAIGSGNSHDSQELLLPGLDAALDSLLREILRRASWSRQELEAMAAERQIMLDGALEQINEAAFDLLGEPLTEGDDPITVQQTILENAEL